MISLKSSDGQEFKVDRVIAEKSVTIKHLIEDVGDEGGASIPLSKVSGPILAKVLEWCEHHRNDIVPEETEEPAQRPSEDIDQWDANFVKVDQGTLFEVILAANFLDIKALLDLTCKAVANMIKGKTTEQIRETFNIENDFTPEEEEAVRKENEWCEDR